MAWSKEKKIAYGKEKTEASKTTWYDNLAAGIEGNNVPWRKPWKGGATMPRNLVSKKSYRGGNIVSLWFWGLSRGYTDLRFATRKQLLTKGMSIKGLSNGGGCLIKFAKTSNYKYEDKDTGEEKTRSGFVTRWYEVFCVEQCEDYEAPVVKDENLSVTPESDMMKSFYGYVDSQQTLTLERQGSRAFYRLSGDLIRLPAHADFETQLGEVMTAMHEAVHSTGHPSRAERNLQSKFGSPEYAFEELVAELGSLIVTLSLGGEFNPYVLAEEHANSQAYLKIWLDACKNQDNALDKAFTQAQAAADFILNNCSVEEELSE
jgi:antirestriction protein ArdC